jgi:hypothetical protein
MIVVNYCLYVAVGGVFAFVDLDLPSATVCEVFNECPLCVEGVLDRLDEVWFVMFGFMMWS